MATKRKPSVAAITKLEQILNDLDKWRERYHQYDRESCIVANRLENLLQNLKSQRGDPE